MALASDGKPVGGEVSLTAGLPGQHKLPQVAREEKGSFLVVWQSEGPDGSLWGIFGRRVGADGQPLGEAFQINTYGEHDQSDPSVTQVAGDFLVTWTSYGQDGDMGGIYAQRIGASGLPEGDEIAVNTTTAGHQGFSQSAADVSGNVVVAWESQEENGNSIYFQRFDRRGARIEDETPVVSSQGGLQELVSLNVDPLGSFAVVLQRYDTLGRDLGRYQQSFLPDGSRAGGETLILPPVGQ